MSFDEQVDKLKEELRTNQLEPAQRAEAVATLVSKLQNKISSRRLEFALNETPGSYSLTVKHTGTKEDLAAITVNEDGSITFRAIATDEDVMDDDDDEDLGYFPAYVEYFDEAEFLEDIPEVLKLGVAEYELDQEEGGAGA
ncbi:hypothetical protein [Dichotomicrobium thermohalophilum]|uniref:Uncharacterized protein n=1 Tax=Dichotomicrobium thermohalophilum TaxID=933063 RepID=A0A397Q131_9HYPH|nr:hypothetical protein [Dichotomicrobium thermohalophilum]RIA55106.1 hypothetical protein BXY53_0159 [Dichotomicrobium thermohalophilum]